MALFRVEVTRDGCVVYDGTACFWVVSAVRWVCFVVEVRLYDAGDCDGELGARLLVILPQSTSWSHKISSSYLDLLFIGKGCGCINWITERILYSLI